MNTTFFKGLFAIVQNFAHSVGVTIRQVPVRIANSECLFALIPNSNPNHVYIFALVMPCKIFPELWGRFGTTTKDKNFFQAVIPWGDEYKSIKEPHPEHENLWDDGLFRYVTTLGCDWGYLSPNLDCLDIDLNEFRQWLRMEIFYSQYSANFGNNTYRVLDPELSIDYSQSLGFREIKTKRQKEAGTIGQNTINGIDPHLSDLSETKNKMALDSAIDLQTDRWSDQWLNYNDVRKLQVSNRRKK